MSDLELRVAQGLMQFRALETALHSPFGWELEVDGVRFPAGAWRHTHGVEIVAGPGVDLPDQALVSLMHDGQVMLARTVIRPPDYTGELAWDLTVGEEQHA